MIRDRLATWHDDECYCHDCGRETWMYRDDCPECDGPLDVAPGTVRARKALEDVVALGIVVAIFVGPPAYAIHRALTADALLTTREVTVTTTHVGGALPDVGLALGLWFVALFLVWGLAGGFPRP